MLRTDIIFICDEPHVVNIARNNVAHSGFDNNLPNFCRIVDITSHGVIFLI